MGSAIDFATAFRKLGCPSLSSPGTFTYSTESFDPELAATITKLKSSQAGRIEEIIVDGYDRKLEELATLSHWSKLEFTFKASTAGEVSVYENIEQLLSRARSISRGTLPASFYLIAENFCSDEDSAPIEKIENLKKLCRLIICLSDLASYHDQKLSGHEYKLVFVEEDGIKGARALTIQPRIDSSLLGHNTGHTLIEALQQENYENNPQLSKERSIFRASIIEFLSPIQDSTERFKTLVSNWCEFLKLYQNNLDTYLSGFSFHKAKQEVASAELTIAEQLSKVISDISGKVLSIPVSLAATIAVTKADGVLDSTVIVAGIAVASALMAETLDAQSLQYKRIKHSRKLIFSSHDKKSVLYPLDLRVSLKDAIDGLSRNERKLRNSLLVLRFTCWLPTVVALGLHMHTFRALLARSSEIIPKLLCSNWPQLQSYL